MGINVGKASKFRIGSVATGFALAACAVLATATSAWADSGGVSQISVSSDNMGRYSASFTVQGQWNAIKMNYCRGDQSKILMNKHQALSAAGVCSGHVYGGPGYGDEVETAAKGQFIRPGSKSFGLMGMSSGSGEWYIGVTLDNGESRQSGGTNHHDGGNHPWIHPVYIE